MSKAALKRIKKDVATALRNFGNELCRSGIIKDDEGFKIAAHQCANGPVPVVEGVNIRSAQCWGYQLSNVQFHIQERDRDYSIVPDGAYIHTITMHALVIGNLIDDQTIDDPFAHLELNIIVYAESAAGIPLVCCWHLDRDLEGGNDPEDVHPIYHFTYGGKYLEPEKGAYLSGSNVTIDTPRFAHLPLDAVLGVDFILSNYFGRTRKKLFQEKPFYKNHLEISQDMIWRPYAHAAAAHWTKPLYSNWSAKKIWPQLAKQVLDIQLKNCESSDI